MNQKLRSFFKENNIPHNIFTHEPLFTCEDAQKISHTIPGEDCKNLFLTDKTNYFVYSTLAEKRVDLKRLGQKIGVKRLSFGKPEKLQEYLKITPGSVNPFALFFDETQSVKLYLDSEMMIKESLGFHPMLNTETLVLSPENLKTFLTKANINYMEISHD